MHCACERTCVSSFRMGEDMCSCIAYARGHVLVRCVCERTCVAALRMREDMR